MELVLRCIAQVVMTDRRKQNREYDRFLELRLKLRKIVRHNKHLDMVERLLFGRYKLEQLRRKLSENEL